MVAAVIKPQLGILIPIVAAVVIRRYLIDADTGTPSSACPAASGTVPRSSRLPGAHHRARRVPHRNAARPAVRPEPDRPAPPGRRDRRRIPVSHRQRVQPVGAHLAGRRTGRPRPAPGSATSSAPLASPDSCSGRFPAVVVGTLLLLVAIVGISVIVARRPDRLTILVGVIALAVAFFVVPTRVHERYLFPFFALAAIVAAPSRRWLAAYVAMGIATFANMYVVLTTYYPDNPGISDWLGLGEDLKSPISITIFALIQLAGLHLDRLAAARPGTHEIGRRHRGVPDRRGAGARGRRRTRARPGARARARGDHASQLADSDLDWAAEDRVVAPPRDWLAPPSPDAPGFRASIARALLARPRRADRIGRARAASRAGGSAASTSGCSSCCSSRRSACGRSGSTSRTDALRRGLPRPYRDRVPPALAVRRAARHLRVDAPAPGQVRDGGGARGVRQRPGHGHGRAGRPGASTPRSSRAGTPGPPGRPSRRPPLRGDGQRGRALRPRRPIAGSRAAAARGERRRRRRRQPPLYAGTDDGGIHAYDTALLDEIRAGAAVSDTAPILPTYSLGSVAAPITRPVRAAERERADRHDGRGRGPDPRRGQRRGPRRA